MAYNRSTDPEPVWSLDDAPKYGYRGGCGTRQVFYEILAFCEDVYAQTRSRHPGFELCLLFFTIRLVATLFVMLNILPLEHAING